MSAIAAPDAARVQRGFGHPELQVRGARDQRELPGAGDAEPDHADQGVRPALHHLDRARQPERLGGLSGQRAEHLAGGGDPWRPLLEQLPHVQRLDEAPRPAALARAVVPAQAHVVETRRPLARQVPGQEILVLADAVRAGEGLGLVPLQPQRLRDHPLGRHGPGPVAVERERRVAGGEHGLRLGTRAHVHPDHRRAERLAALVERDDRAAGRGVGDRLDRRRLHPGRVDRAARGGDEVRPPVSRVLLDAVAGLEARLVGDGVTAEAVACEIVNARAQALGAAVGGQEVGHAASPLVGTVLPPRLYPHGRADGGSEPYLTAPLAATRGHRRCRAGASAPPSAGPGAACARSAERVDYVLNFFVFAARMNRMSPRPC